MGLSLQQLRDDTRKHLGGLDEIDMPNTEVDLLLNRSWWQIADDYDFREKETSRAYNTVIGTGSYATANDLEGLQQVAIEDINSGQHINLTPMTLLTYETLYVDKLEARGKPEFYIRRNNNVVLYPPPDAVYGITEYYWKTLSDIAVGGPPIPQAWHEIIMYGAVYRGFAAAGDYNRSRAAKLMQAELMSTKDSVESEEKADRPLAGVQVLRPRYR